jgi:periplasmic mercuric ion binding protein
MEKLHMKKLAGFAAALALLASSSAIAAEKTVTLAVQNMYCAACPYTVRASLQAVPGVENVTVSLQQKTAVVTYDDARTNVNALTAATINAGYPSSPTS